MLISIYKSIYKCLLSAFIMQPHKLVCYTWTFTRVCEICSFQFAFSDQKLLNFATANPRDSEERRQLRVNYFQLYHV